VLSRDTSSLLIASKPEFVPSPLRCLAMLLAIVVSLRIRGFASTLRTASTIVAKVSRPPSEGAAAERQLVERTMNNVVLAAALLPFKARCLEQSLAIFVFLRRRGVPVELRIGVQPYRFRAHAWVEYAGVPVNESADYLTGFVPLPSLPL